MLPVSGAKKERSPGSRAPSRSARSVSSRRGIVRPARIPTPATSSSHCVHWYESAVSILRRHGAIAPRRNPIRGEPGSCPEHDKLLSRPPIADRFQTHAPIFLRAEADVDRSAELSYVALGLYQLLVEVLRLMYRTFQGEELRYSPNARLTEAQGQLLVLQQPTHGGGKRGRVPRRHEQSADPVFDDLRIASHPGSDHGDARSHRFEQGIRRTLAQRREHRDRGFR